MPSRPHLTLGAILWTPATNVTPCCLNFAPVWSGEDASLDFHGAPICYSGRTRERDFAPGTERNYTVPATHYNIQPSRRAMIRSIVRGCLKRRTLSSNHSSASAISVTTC
jgi:hypothetical protein